MVLEAQAHHIEVGDSLFYHTDYIETPKWADLRQKAAQVGRHIFYFRAL